MRSLYEITLSAAFLSFRVSRGESHLKDKEDPMNNKETILIDGVRYHKDRNAGSAPTTSRNAGTESAFIRAVPMGKSGTPLSGEGL